MCEEATKGALKITVYPSGELFSIAKILSAVSSGAVDLGGVLDLNFAAVDRNFEIGGLAFFFDSYPQQRDFWTQTPEGKGVWEGIQKKLGVVVLCHDPVGPSTFWSSKRSLEKIENFEGLKARFLTNSEKPMWKALGTSFVAVSTSEVYSALQSGMIDTLSTVPSATKAYNWWDFLKYVQLPYGSYQDSHIVVNARWWNSLPREIRDIVLTQVAPKISEDSTKEVIIYSDAIIKEFVEKHGGTATRLVEKELERMVALQQKEAWPEVAKIMNPQVWEAALKFTKKKR
jgi:TRAP-type C4-dicarboxylate transport system substrate-binding protein